MHNLVIILVAMVTVGVALPTMLTCANGGVPLFTNETFCTTTQKITTCCHGNENNEKENDFKKELKKLLGLKFSVMKRGLLDGARVLGATRCPNETTTNLLQQASSSLTKLGSVDWSDLFQDDSNYECKIKQAFASICASEKCAPLPLLTLLPCHSFCLNILRGCHHDLSENLLLPWKYAVNSVRAAMRLLLTLKCEEIAMETKLLENIIGNMNGDWREPFSWVDGVCDLKGAAVDNNCWAGEFDRGEGLPTPSTYTKPVPPWSTRAEKYSNPEFTQNSQLSLEFESKINVVREELLSVAKHLEKFWPPNTSPSDSSSSLSPSQSTSQSDESFEYDEEYDTELSSSGSGFYDNQHFQTDDEDLLPSEGSGEEENEIKATSTTDIFIETTNSSKKMTFCWYLLILLFIL